MIDKEGDDEGLDRMLWNDWAPSGGGTGVTVVDPSGTPVGTAHYNPETGTLEIDQQETTIIDEQRTGAGSGDTWHPGPQSGLETPGGSGDHTGGGAGSVTVVDGSGNPVGTGHYNPETGTVEIDQPEETTVIEEQRTGESGKSPHWTNLVNSLPSPELSDDLRISPHGLELATSADHPSIEAVRAGNGWKTVGGGYKERYWPITCFRPGFPPVLCNFIVQRPLGRMSDAKANAILESATQQALDLAKPKADGSGMSPCFYIAEELRTIFKNDSLGFRLVLGAI